MISILLKATGIWMVIVVGAILNGLIREKIIVPLIGFELALPLSGVLLSVLVLLISYLLIPFLKSSEAITFVAIGLFWVILTLSFEFLFGYFVIGKSWRELIQVFYVCTGNLFVLVLAITAGAPWLSAKIRGIL